MFLATLLLSIGLMTFVMAGIGLRILLVKGGQFRGTCANNNPMLEEKIGKCTVCGRTAGEACKADEVKQAV
ncbi:hypothetical protein C7N43_01410 [Sphingobacteriales bacterium UPWRP_1]|nr:hypothetical protein BVG80_10380 [Sphingobacteriales bacterium TSM_CSM]PSJ78825.1 hypothetical protein C7N43_01410 [Sphingobacteriales bacterium UPWRP_1]